ncbi:LTA synthase family protein [Miniphocaeibacter massiliensis]|uniref:LTA synthase family protein n=1 Tax=Miniphocaeibacter massiliensis TaxID=2041841 RepID=UPI0013EC70C8|nr:LTA synthase family protein [Miniphocaeibacter massiliensis]
MITINKKRITNLLVIIFCLIIVASLYIKFTFRDQTIEEILFYAFNGGENSSSDVFITAIKKAILPLIVFVGIILFVKNRFFENHQVKFTLAFFTLTLLIFTFSLRVDLFIKNSLASSDFIEENYIDGRKVNITFPEKKKNLIVIFAESMENSLIDKELGGGWEYSVMPELEELALSNTNFSNNKKIGGFYHTNGSTWTVSGIVAITSGINMKVSMANTYTSDNFLSGTYALGDILKENGYNLKVCMGSDSKAGNKDKYFLSHGNYDIFDFNYAVDNGYMKSEDKVWWGFDDTDLFKWTKEETLELAKDDKPFNLVIETANTHFENGYLEEEAPKKFNTQYENVYSYNSTQINEYINWVKEQDFYKDTTIVVLGDHLGMQTDFYEDNMIDGHERSVYNVFINPSTEPKNSKNRTMTSFDMYPTILASIGANIEGNQLGLGVNLFSDKETLSEKYGYDFLNEEVGKNSKFFNDFILGDDYKDVIKLEKEKEAKEKEEAKNKK